MGTGVELVPGGTQAESQVPEVTALGHQCCKCNAGGCMENTGWYPLGGFPGITAQLSLNGSRR